MPQKLYGIAEFHPQVLLRYAWNSLSDDVRKFYGEEIQNLQLHFLYEKSCLRVSSIALVQYQSNNRRLLGRGHLVELQNASRAAETAAEIIAKESQIIRDLHPDMVYLEGNDSNDPYDNMFHPLSRVIRETGAQRVWLGVPEGYREKIRELRRRMGTGPINKALEEEWRMLIEEKDSLWGDSIPKIAANYSGKGLIVVGGDHLIEHDGYRGLTAHLLKEKGFEVEILLVIDRREIAEQIGVHYYQT